MGEFKLIFRAGAALKAEAVEEVVAHVCTLYLPFEEV